MKYKGKPTYAEYPKTKEAAQIALIQQTKKFLESKNAAVVKAVCSNEAYEVWLACGIPYGVDDTFTTWTRLQFALHCPKAHRYLVVPAAATGVDLVELAQGDSVVACVFWISADDARASLEKEDAKK